MHVGNAFSEGKMEKSGCTGAIFSTKEGELQEILLTGGISHRKMREPLYQEGVELHGHP